MAEEASPEDLNYGFFMLRYDENMEGVPLVHAKWTRMGGLAAWGLVELVAGSGDYDFSLADPIIKEAHDAGIQLLLNINQGHGGDFGASSKSLPIDLEAYKRFVRAFVERYDGDGVDDAPSSPARLTPVPSS